MSLQSGLEFQIVTGEGNNRICVDARRHAAVQMTWCTAIGTSLLVIVRLSSGIGEGSMLDFLMKVDFLCRYLACVGNDGLTNVAFYPLHSFSQQTREMATEKQREYSAIADPITTIRRERDNEF